MSDLLTLSDTEPCSGSTTPGEVERTQLIASKGLEQLKLSLHVVSARYLPTFPSIEVCETSLEA